MNLDFKEQDPMYFKPSLIIIFHNGNVLATTIFRRALVLLPLLIGCLASR